MFLAPTVSADRSANFRKKLNFIYQKNPKNKIKTYTSKLLGDREALGLNDLFKSVWD